MAKKKNKNVDVVNEYDTQIDYPVPFPTPVERDILSMMDEETLHGLSRSLTDSISKVNSFKLNPYLWEIELCYVQQEIQARSLRKEAHAAWLSARAPEEFN